MKINFSQDKSFINSYFCYLLNSQDSFSENSQKALLEAIPELAKKPNYPYLTEDVLKSEIQKYWSNNDKLISDYSIKLKKIWSKYEEKIANTLSQIFEVNLEKDVTIYLYTLRWYPRFLDDQSMILSALDPIYFSISTVIHEITHFYYFKKWKELFPEDEDYSYEAPHIFWHLSEIMAPVVNSDARIKKIFPDTNSTSMYAYNRFDKSGTISIQGYFENLYNKSTSIESFLREAREVALSNESLIKKAY